MNKNKYFFKIESYFEKNVFYIFNLLLKIYIMQLTIKN